MKRFAIATAVVLLVFCVAFGVQRKKKPKYVYLKPYLSEPTGQTEFEALCQKASFEPVKLPRCTENLVFESMEFVPTKKGVKFKIVCQLKDKKRLPWKWEHKDAYWEAVGYFGKITGCGIKSPHFDTSIPSRGVLKIGKRTVIKKADWNKKASIKPLKGRPDKPKLGGKERPGK